jgi:hypothetical protein
VGSFGSHEVCERDSLIDIASLNERIQIQQGEMLCGLLHRPVFSTILLSMLIKPGKAPHQFISKVIVDRKERSSD